MPPMFSARALNSALLDIDQTPDRDLLHRYSTTRDNSAFELLVRRHADLVWCVCRSILHDDFQAAEDAFQAAFIALARQASRLTEQVALGAWLFRVARHAALRLRKKKSKTAADTLPTEIAEHADSPISTVEEAEESSLLVQEIDLLPARYREPVILCFFQGLSHVQAARQLGWSVGTVASRIARAKVKLRVQLASRGLALGASLATAIGLSPSCTARPPLVRFTVYTAANGPVPTHLHTLTCEVIAIMTRFPRKWQLIAPILALGLALGGALAGVSATTEPISTSAPAEQPRVELANTGRGLTIEIRADKPALAGAKERAARQRSLTTIAQAIWAFNADRGYLPTDIVDRDGKPLLSWRVAILPYLEQRNLYKLFKLDEPWDSAANKPLADTIVKLYAPLEFDREHPHHTYIKRFTGANTLHRPGEKIELAKMPKNTLLLAEVGDPVPWTKPADPLVSLAAADKPFVPKTPPVWSGPYSNVVNAAFADGRAHSLKPDLPVETVAAMIYANEKKVLPPREDLEAIIPEKQESDEIKELLKVLKETTERLAKLSEEQSQLMGELSRLTKKPSDPAVQLAKEVIELDAQVRSLYGRIRELQRQIEQAKKAK